MGADLVTSLLFKQPLPVSSISLGRLVRDPLYPDVNYYDPIPSPHTSSPAAGQKPHEQAEQPEALPASQATEIRVEDFENTLEAARGTRLELSLLKLLSRLSLQGSASTTLRSRLCVVRGLRDADAFFLTACRGDAGARAWLEAEAARPPGFGGRRRRGGNAYLVCAFETLTDATVSHHSRRGKDTGVSADVPVAAIATGGAGSLAAAVETGASSGERLSYTAQGERVYAVVYRRVRFSWFAARSADSAYLDKGVRWKSMVGSRGDDDGDDDELRVELAGAPEADELDGRFESAKIGGEYILYEDDIEEVDEDDRMGDLSGDEFEESSQDIPWDFCEHEDSFEDVSDDDDESEEFYEANEGI
ncbi:hypothetical protein RB595_001858 [Gaeumannomyces hyphopodioides]